MGEKEIRCLFRSLLAPLNDGDPRFLDGKSIKNIFITFVFENFEKNKCKHFVFEHFESLGFFKPILKISEGLIFVHLLICLMPDDKQRCETA
jgi:hypothetical protein